MNENTSSIALITGATDGIGKETARQLAAQGITVIIGARNPEKGFSVVEEFKSQGLTVGTVQLDIADEVSVELAAQVIDTRYGRLDILVNNAGTAFDRGPLSELPVQDFIATFETNVFGTFRTIQRFLPLIRRSNHGRIVNVTSSLGSLSGMTDEASPYYNVSLPAYAASKATLNVLTIHLARELKDTGIKVNAVEPGLTATRYVSLPGAQPVEVGAEASVRYALIGEDGPTGGFFDRFGPYKW